MLLLDTSVLIDVERGHKPTIERLGALRQEHPGKVAIAFATLAEFVHGALGRGKRIERVLEELESYEVLEADAAVAIRWALLNHEMRRAGFVLTQFDLLIAAIAYESGALLVTRDKAFANIPGVDLLVL